MKKLLPAIFLLLCVAPQADAQRILRSWRKRTCDLPDSVAQQAARYADKLERLKAKYRNWNYQGGDTLSNPFYYALFAPPTFYPQTLSRQVGSLVAPQEAGGCDGTLETPARELQASIDRFLLQAYAERPWLVCYDLTAQSDRKSLSMSGSGAGKNAEKKIEKPAEPLPEAPSPPVFLGDKGDFSIVVRRPNFWTVKGNFSLQFMQNYVTDNWYKGGESNHSMMASFNIEANYNNKQKVTFDNKLETKLGFQSSHQDDKRKYKTNTDLLRLTNKLGLRATKHWYYTVMLQSWTQFYRGYKANDDYVYSDFMSPFESLLSIGMDYKLEKPKFKLTATISPLAADLKTVSRGYLATSFGIDEGKRAKCDFGSNITMNYTWTICKNVTWQGRIYYFTSYKRSQAEWENTFSLKVNRFLSTKLFLYPRFDDGVTRAPDGSYFQFNENLSVGLDVTF